MPERSVAVQLTKMLFGIDCKTLFEHVEDEEDNLALTSVTFRDAVSMTITTRLHFLTYLFMYKTWIYKRTILNTFTNKKWKKTLSLSQSELRSAAYKVKRISL